MARCRLDLEEDPCKQLAEEEAEREAERLVMERRPLSRQAP